MYPSVTVKGSYGRPASVSIICFGRMASDLLSEDSCHDHADPAAYCMNHKYVERIEKGIAYFVSHHASAADKRSDNTKQRRNAARDLQSQLVNCGLLTNEPAGRATHVSSRRCYCYQACNNTIAEADYRKFPFMPQLRCASVPLLLKAPPSSDQCDRHPLKEVPRQAASTSGEESGHTCGHSSYIRSKCRAAVKSKPPHPEEDGAYDDVDNAVGFGSRPMPRLVPNFSCRIRTLRPLPKLDGICLKAFISEDSLS
jgi:hypothetical protein